MCAFFSVHDFQALNILDMYMHFAHAHAHDPAQSRMVFKLEDLQDLESVTDTLACVSKEIDLPPLGGKVRLYECECECTCTTEGVPV